MHVNHELASGHVWPIKRLTSSNSGLLSPSATGEYILDFNDFMLLNILAFSVNVSKLGLVVYYLHWHRKASRRREVRKQNCSKIGSLLSRLICRIILPQILLFFLSSGLRIPAMCFSEKPNRIENPCPTYNLHRLHRNKNQRGVDSKRSWKISET